MNNIHFNANSINNPFVVFNQVPKKKTKAELEEEKRLEKENEEKMKQAAKKKKKEGLLSERNLYQRLIITLISFNIELIVISINAQRQLNVLIHPIFQASSIPSSGTQPRAVLSSIWPTCSSACASPTRTTTIPKSS